MHPAHMGFLKSIGSSIKRYRRKMGLSQEELADLAGLHRTYVGGVERGERNISVLSLCKITNALRIKPYILLRERDEAK